MVKDAEMEKVKDAAVEKVKGSAVERASMVPELCLCCLIDVRNANSLVDLR